MLTTSYPEAEDFMICSWLDFGTEKKWKRQFIVHANQSES